MTEAQEACVILRAPRRSAKHKNVSWTNASRLIGFWGSTCAETDGHHFLFVNESPRRLLLRRDGVDGLGASRPFALTTCVGMKERGRNARTLCDQGGPCGAIGCARRAGRQSANFWRS